MASFSATLEGRSSTCTGAGEEVSVDMEALSDVEAFSDMEASSDMEGKGLQLHTTRR